MLAIRIGVIVLCSLSLAACSAATEGATTNDGAQNEVNASGEAFSPMTPSFKAASDACFSSTHAYAREHFFNVDVCDGEKLASGGAMLVMVTVDETGNPLQIARGPLELDTDGNIYLATDTLSRFDPASDSWKYTSEIKHTGSFLAGKFTGDLQTLERGGSLDGHVALADGMRVVRVNDPFTIQNKARKGDVAILTKALPADGPRTRSPIPLPALDSDAQWETSCDPNPGQ